MSLDDISKAMNPDMRSATAALARAAQAARQKAIESNTGIVVMRDGKQVLITADELRQAAENEKQP